VLEPNVLSHIVLLYLYQNSVEVFYERLKTSIISVALRRGMGKKLLNTGSYNRVAFAYFSAALYKGCV